jgi:hypothetical protein
MRMNEAINNKQNPVGYTQLDLVGWSGYVIGFLLSIWGRHQTGALIAAIGLLWVILFYSRKAVNDLLRLAYKTREQINIVLLISFIILLFLKFRGVAALCLGANFFLYGCLSLKGQKIYVGRQWRLEDRDCYTRNANPGYYWMYTLLFLVLGYILLISPLLLNRWFAS